MLIHWQLIYKSTYSILMHELGYLMTT